MCLQCHGKDKKYDSEANSNLVDCLSNPQFETWNSCSVSHLFIYYSGANGWQSQEAAEKVIKKLIKYLHENQKTNIETYIPEPFRETDNIVKMYENMKKYPKLKINEINFEKRKKDVFHGDFLNRFFLAEC